MSADIGRETFARSAEMHGIHSRQIIFPETQLRHGAKSGEEHSPAEHFQAVRGGIEKHVRDDEQSRQEEHAQKRAAAGDGDREQRQHDSSGQSAEFLDLLNLRDGFAAQRGDEFRHFVQTGCDLRSLLDRTERRSVGAGEEQRCDDGGAAVGGLEQLGKMRTLERAGFALLFPDGRFGKKRPDDGERNGGNDRRHQRVSPRRVAVVNGGKRHAEMIRQVIGLRHRDAAKRGERLRPPEHALARFRLGEDFGQPRD